MRSRVVNRRFFGLSFLVVALGLSIGTPAWSNEPGPTGRWVTIDDDGHTKKSIVEIQARGGRLFGTIVHIFDPAKRNNVCEKCTDDRAGQPLIGLEVIRGLERDGDEWTDGKILDPANGKEYSCTLRRENDKLLVRGYVGVSLFGRSQTWIRPN